MAAFTFLAVKRKNREQHAALSLLLLSQSDKATKQLEAWEKDS